MCQTVDSLGTVPIVCSLQEFRNIIHQHHTPDLVTVSHASRSLVDGAFT